MACCTFEETIDLQFTRKKAEQELERYRWKGAGPTGSVCAVLRL